tara:strand:- start:2797 stop:3348 length:552 start_codon:yes stop_codon:yes gene_type:complete
MPPQPERHFHGKVEIILGNEWTAEYFDAEEASPPNDVPMIYGYACVVRGDYGYVTERDQARDGWSVVEGNFLEGETAEEFVTRSALEQTGANISQTLLIGYLDCRATSANEHYEKHFRAIRPMYVGVAREVGPVPEGSDYHRRRLPMNQFQNELRKRYSLLSDHFAKGLSRYTILERTGKLKS